MWDVIAFVITWIIIPVIMLQIFWLGRLVISHSIGEERHKSAVAGFWGGLLIFILFIISQIDRLLVPDFRFAYLPDISLPVLAIGLAVGFVFLASMKFLINTRLIGLMTMALTAVSLSALFTYVFIYEQRPLVMYLSLGAVLGAFVFFVFFPSLARQVLD